MDRIPYLRPHVVSVDKYIHLLQEIERSHVYSNFGPMNRRFEDQVLQRIYGGAGAVTTVNNATTGLILAMQTFKRAGGKYAIMPSFTFAATPLAAIWCGLEPYFVDIRPGDWCMDELLLRRTLSELGEEAAVVVPYAAFGTAMNLRYYQLLHDSGTPVVVDAAASFGTIAGSGEPFGHQFPGAIVFSFHATKSFGIGEGGLIYSSDEDAIHQIQSMENFGFKGSSVSMVQGMNGKLSEYAAAIALATLEVFQEKKRRRSMLRSRYMSGFKRSGLFAQGWACQAAQGDTAWASFQVLCPQGRTNREAVDLLAEHQIETRTYFSPACHKHPVFARYARTSMTVTDNISERILCLPFYEDLSEEAVDRIVDLLGRIVDCR